MTESEFDGVWNGVILSRWPKVSRAERNVLWRRLRRVDVNAFQQAADTAVYEAKSARPQLKSIADMAWHRQRQIDLHAHQGDAAPSPDDETSDLPMPVMRGRMEPDGKTRSPSVTDLVAGLMVNAVLMPDGGLWGIEKIGCTRQEPVRYALALREPHSGEPRTLWADEWTNEHAAVLAPLAHELKALAQIFGDPWFAEKAADLERRKLTGCPWNANHLCNPDRLKRAIRQYGCDRLHNKKRQLNFGGERT